MDNVLKYLQLYFALGWRVFPCSSKDKSPLTEHGHKDATSDLAQVEQWIRQYPSCAWGVPTSAEFGVIDIDPRNSGDLSLAKILDAHGPLPQTPTVRTGGGGWHYWVRFPEGTRTGVIDKGIDRKAEGGYVIVPPSLIAIPEHQGRAYRWKITPWGNELAAAPAWAFATSKGKASAPAEANPWVVPSADTLLTHAGSPEGRRRETLCRLVGLHLARGDSESTIMALAKAWAAKCNPPFEDWQKHTQGLIEKERGVGVTTTIHPIPFSEATEFAFAPANYLINSQSDQQMPANYLINSAHQQGEFVRKFDCSPEVCDQQESKLVSSPTETHSPYPSKLVSSPHEKGGRECVVTPTLSPEAYSGLLGDMLKAIEPETEAHPAGILLSWLACLGNCVGRNAYFKVGATKHYPALYVGIVGNTSDAKGDSWAVSLYPFREANPQWASTCITNGIGSGEGLIERIADGRNVLGKDGKVIEIPGAKDKRCLLRLSELSKCFKVQRRDCSTLSETLREMWDGNASSVPNRKDNALSTSEYTVSVLGDITPSVLHKLLSTGTEGFDGFANRFLWVYIQRTRYLPNGGNTSVLDPFIPRLKEVIDWSKQAGELRRDAEANALWVDKYPELTHSGDSVPHTDRARPQVARLSMLFAIADRSRVINLNHLRSALAVWDYCRCSAQLLFANQQLHDPLWLQVRNLITQSSGISRKQIHEAFNNKLKAEELDKALSYLVRNQLAYCEEVKPIGGGRPAECWYPFANCVTTLTPSILTGQTVFAGELTNKLPTLEHGEQTNYLTNSSGHDANASELTNKLPNSANGKEEELVSSIAGTKQIPPKVEGKELVSSFAPETHQQERGKGKGMGVVVERLLTLEEAAQLEDEFLAM